jgi:hypothetical protein
MLDTYRELLDLLVETPMKLKDGVAAAGAPPEGEWGPGPLLHHMAVAERLYRDRLETILNQRNALIKPGWTPASAELNERLKEDDAEGNLEEFNSQRGETISFLMGLSLNDWGKAAIHATRGEIRIEDVVEDMVDHDAEHLAQLQALAGAST